LETLQTGEYSVVVSDFKMPGMDGVQFLAEVKRRAPETVRILLTGEVDFHTAIAAVNEGNVFRFLSKPCSHELLTKTLDAALEQYRLQTAERDVLRETLMGTAAVLVEILALTHPVAFGRASRARWNVRTMARELQSANHWEFEAAAMLPQTDCIAVPQELLAGTMPRAACQKASLNRSGVIRTLQGSC
jgi:YesN/AraC family two-component response regulator